MTFAVSRWWHDLSHPQLSRNWREATSRDREEPTVHDIFYDQGFAHVLALKATGMPLAAHYVARAHYVVSSVSEASQNAK